MSTDKKYEKPLEYMKLDFDFRFRFDFTKGEIAKLYDELVHKNSPVYDLDLKDI